MILLLWVFVDKNSTINLRIFISSATLPGVPKNISNASWAWKADYSTNRKKFWDQFQEGWIIKYKVELMLQWNPFNTDTILNFYSLQARVHHLVEECISG